MFSSRERKKTKMEGVSKPLSWQEKKEIADKEEEVLQKDIDDLKNWIEMVEAMDDEQMKEYLKTSPDELKTLKLQSMPKQKVKRTKRSKSSASTGIMASVWKFHKEDNEESSVNSAS